MTNDKIAKAEAKLAKREAQIRKAKDAARIQKRKLVKLKKDVRTHQLCVRGGELNRLLQRPDDLTDEQVKQFLRDVFDLPAVQERLTAILPPNPVDEVVQELESEAQEQPEEPAPQPQAKPPDNGKSIRPQNSCNKKQTPSRKKKKKKR